MKQHTNEHNESLEVSSKLPKLCIIFLAVSSSTIFCLWIYAQIVKPFSEYAQLKKDKNGSKLQLIAVLNRVIEIPVLGQYFKEQLIEELVVLSRWAQVIPLAESALLDQYNAQKFAIYYHLALSYCMTQNFRKCRSRSKDALKYATLQTYDYLYDLYLILLSNNYIKKSQIPAPNQVGISPPSPNFASDRSTTQSDISQL